MISRERNILPGFRWTLSFTLLYLALVVLIPLAAVFLKTATGTWAHFWQAISHPRVIASIYTSFVTSLAAAIVNVLFGLLVAWVLVRYRFPGRAIADAMIDLPFALPTAVAGISLATLYVPKGWIGQYLERIGLRAVFNLTGITIALIFIGLPFVVRTVQPVLQDLDAEVEEAAASLGASRFQIWWLVILPSLIPALLTGFALSFARSLGEYGSVVFISGNLQMKTEIVPLLIMTKLEQNDYTGATALAVLMLVASFILLLLINSLQAWTGRHLASHH